MHHQALGHYQFQIHQLKTMCACCTFLRSYSFVLIDNCKYLIDFQLIDYLLYQKVLNQKDKPLSFHGLELTFLIAPLTVVDLLFLM